MTSSWWRITAPHFVAALHVEGGRVAETAPILGWTRGRAWAEVRTELQAKGWHGATF